MQFVFTHMTLELYGMGLFIFFVQEAVKLHKNKISEEYLEEKCKGWLMALQQMALKQRDDIIGWNDWIELTRLLVATVAANYSNNPPQGPRGSHCSGLLQLDLLRGMENLSLLTVLTILEWTILQRLRRSSPS